MTLRLMLVDDHATFRDALCLFLELQADIRVVAEVADGHGVLREFAHSQPDVVCMDVNLQGLSGIEATRELLRQYGHARVIGLSAHVDLRRVAEMFGAGARGYVIKGSPGAELLAAVRAVGRGEVYLSPELGIASVADLARYAMPSG